MPSASPKSNGKLLAEMLGQLKYHPEWWRYFGGLADKIEGAVVPIDKPDMSRPRARAAFSEVAPRPTCRAVSSLTQRSSPT
jgi:hypothetical protein